VDGARGFGVELVEALLDQHARSNLERQPTERSRDTLSRNPKPGDGPPLAVACDDRAEALAESIGKRLS
jgi:hypothetical protein